MKKFILWATFILLVSMLIPLATGIKWESNSSPTQEKPKNSQTTQFSPEDINTICCMSMEYLSEDTDRETKLAVLSIITNNYLHTKEEKKSPKIEISKYSDNLLSELKEIISEGLIDIKLNGKRVYIPIVELSSGNIATEDEYPYIKAITSPWDKTSKFYPPNNPNKCGISIFGIEYLSKSYKDAVNALRWYLPDFDITYANPTKKEKPH